MLLQPFEDQRRLAAAAIQCTDGYGAQFELVGEEHERLAPLVLAADAAQRRRLVLGGLEPGEHAVLVADVGDEL